MTQYSEDEAWADIEPLPQDDGGAHPLAAIAYTEEYSEAMSYLRAIMAKNEMSERVLDLTEHIISMNPAHYTVWYATFFVLPIKQTLAMIPTVRQLILLGIGYTVPRCSSQSMPLYVTKSRGSTPPLSSTSKIIKFGTIVKPSSTSSIHPKEKPPSYHACSRLMLRITTCGATGNGLYGVSICGIKESWNLRKKC